MSRLLKILAMLAAAAVTLLLVALVVVLSISDERYRQWTINAVEARTGRSLAMDDFALDIGEVIALEAGGVRLGNAPWAESEAMLTLERVEARVRLFDLVRGRPAIEAHVDGAVLNLERSTAGEANWRMAGSLDGERTGDGNNDGGLSSVALIREIVVSNSRFALDDAVSGAARALAVDSLEIRAGDTIDVSLDGSALDIPLVLSGSLGKTADLVESRRTPVTLAGTAGDTRLDVAGDWNPVHAPLKADIRVALDMPSDAAIVALTGLEKGALANGRIEARLVADQGGYALPKLDVRLDGERLSARIQGSIGGVSPPSGIDLTVDTQVTEPAELLRQLGVRSSSTLPPRITLSGALKGDGETIRASDVSITTGEQDIAVTASGTIAFTQGAVPELNIDFEGAAPSVSALARYAGQSLPELGGLEVTGKVVTSTAGIGLDPIVIELSGRGLDARAEGSIADVTRFAGADLRIRATLSGLEQAAVDGILASASERGLTVPPALLGVNAEVNGLVRGGIENLELSELSGKVQDDGVAAEFTGRIAGLLDEPAVWAEGTVNVDSLDVLGRYTDTGLPVTDPLRLRASLGGDDARDGTPFRLDLAAGGIETTVEGNLGDVRSLEQMAIDFSVKADSLADFSKLAGRELPANGPFQLGGRFEASDGAYALNDFNLKIADQQAAGSLTVTPGNGGKAIGALDGRLAIGRLDLTPLLGLSEEMAGDETIAAGSESASEQRRLFSNETLPFDLLRQYNGDVSITADNITLGKSHLTDLETVVQLKDGRLTIEPLESSVDNGSLTGRATVDATRQRPAVTVFLDMKGAAMPRLGGNLELGLDLEGEGNSAAEIMAGVDGQVLAVITGAQIQSSLLTSFGADLLGTLNPLSRKKDTTTIECGILRMEIEDGIARFDDRLAAQMTETTWRGGGSIDLKTEKLDVGIVPKARKGLGISAGSLASLVQVTGTLTRPVVRPDPTGLAKNYGRYVAAMSTGGLSLLAEGLRDRLQANADVCAQIREGTVFDLPENEGARKSGQE